MLSRQQQNEFFQRGFTSISNAFSRHAAAAMVHRFWSFMEQQNVHRNSPESWPEGQVYGISELKRESEFAEIGSPATLSGINDLLGEDGWRQPSTWGQILATFPATDGRWSWNSIFQRQVNVETILWHTDYEYDLSPDALAGVQVFAILNELTIGGGGTLVVEGSHRVVREFVRHRSPQALANMKQNRLALMNSDPFLQAISNAVSVDRPEQWIAKHKATIGGIPVAVNQVTGRPGDVVLCHPWLLHAPSPNCNEAPRIMCTQRIRKLA